MAPYALIENRLDDAIQELKEALRANPADPRSHNWLGIAYSRKAMYAQAIACFDRAVELAPANERYWFNHGTAHSAADRPLLASRSFQMAVSLAPGYERAREALAALRSAHPEIPTPDLQSSGVDASSLPVAERTTPQVPAGTSTAASLSESESVVSSERQVEWPVASTPFRTAITSGGCPGVWTRIVSTLIDLVVAQLLWLVAIVIVNAVGEIIPSLPNPSTELFIGLGCLCGLGANVWMTMCDGRTVGKRVTHTRVVNHEGFEPSALQSILRLVAYPLHIPTLGLSYLWMHRRPGSRALHDRASLTYVVGRRLDPSSAFISIFTLAGANVLLGGYLFYQVCP